MQLGSIELQIFAALALVLGTFFVALVCDFLKGNNEQLRERNIELRVRQDERERLGLFEPLAHPIAWLQGLATLVRNPALADMAGGAVPQPAAAGANAAPAAHAAAPAPTASAAPPDVADLTAASADRNPQRRHRYDEFKATAKTQSWATKEELEQLAGRAARIRARHEASQRKQEEAIGLSVRPEPAVAEASKPEPVLFELPKPELLRPMRPAVAAEPVALAPVIETPQTVEAALPPPLVEEAQVAEEAQPAPSVVEPAPAAASNDAVPPMVETPAPAPWTFRAVAEDRPRVADIPVAAASTPVSIQRPEAPPLWSELAEPKAPEPAVEPVAEVVEFAEPEMPAASLSLEPRTRIRQIDVPTFGEAATEDVAPVPEPVVVDLVPAPAFEPDEIAPPAPPAVVAASAEPEPQISIWRTSPQPPSGIAIDIEQEEPFVAASAAVTPPPPLSPPLPRLPVVEAQPVNTDVPALDVAALQKATAASAPSRIPPMGAIQDTAAVENRLDLPPGLHESAVLSQLIENQTPFSGVVVAIGLNDYDSLREKLASGTDSVAALSRMVLSMLRAQDFACRFQEDEYILIYPGERGSSAQRRLFQVSEKLWDFQLRSLGNLSVMFSWGGLEVTNETLAEAVASARERMYQTKRNRKPASLDFTVGRKKVVNG